MNDDRKNVTEERGMGIGYVTLIMLFAVICLTVLASLSYQAARANDKLNEKSVYYTMRYISADGRVNEVVSILDELAYEAHETGFFADSFEAICKEESEDPSGRYPDEVVIKRVQEGFMVSYACPITDSLELSVKFLFFDVPQNGARYRVDEWKTVTADSAESEETLGVWDGGALG